MSNHSGKENKANITERFQAVRFTRRSLGYTAKTLLILCLSIALCGLAFTVCARLSSAYIIINEGMAQRAQLILQEGTKEQLRPYFTQECIDADGKLSDASYKQYTVDNYSYSLSFESFSLWPWQSDIQVELVEQVESIQGTVLSSAMNFPPKPPKWTAMRYRLTLVQQEDSWKIHVLTPLELVYDIEPPATYDPNKSPLPMATPGPTPTPSALPLPTIG